MKTLATTALAAAAAMFITACGGGGDTNPVAAPAVPSAPAQRLTGLTIIGNSIARHGPSAPLGWTGDWGMAASAKEKDFAHRVAAGLGLPLQILSGVYLEVGAVATIEASAGPGDVVVVELGDNVQAGDTHFAVRYAGLLAQVRGASHLVCTTTWWNSAAVNDTIITECPKAGGTVVNISDLQAFDQRPGGESVFVDLHPHDNSMATIATRILASLPVRATVPR